MSVIMSFLDRLFPLLPSFRVGMLYAAVAFLSQLIVSLTSLGLQGLQRLCSKRCFKFFSSNMTSNDLQAANPIHEDHPHPRATHHCCSHIVPRAYSSFEKLVSEQSSCYGWPSCDPSYPRSWHCNEKLAIERSSLTRQDRSQDIRNQFGLGRIFMFLFLDARLIHRYIANRCHIS